MLNAMIDLVHIKENVELSGFACLPAAKYITCKSVQQCFHSRDYHSNTNIKIVGDIIAVVAYSSCFFFSFIYSAKKMTATKEHNNSRRVHLNEQERVPCREVNKNRLWGKSGR